MSNWSTINVPSVLGFGIPKTFTGPTNNEQLSARHLQNMPAIEASQASNTSHPTLQGRAYLKLLSHHSGLQDYSGRSLSHLKVKGEENSSECSVVETSRPHNTSPTINSSKSQNSPILCVPNPDTTDNRRQLRSTRVGKLEIAKAKKILCESTHAELDKAFEERGLQIPRAHLTKQDKAETILRYDENSATRDKQRMHIIFNHSGDEEEEGSNTESSMDSRGTQNWNTRGDSAPASLLFTNQRKQTSKPTSGEKRREWANVCAVEDSEHGEVENQPTLEKMVEKISTRLGSATVASSVRNHAPRLRSTAYSTIPEGSDPPLERQVTVELIDLSTASEKGLVAANTSDTPFKQAIFNTVLRPSERIMKTQSPIDQWKHKVAAAEQRDKAMTRKEQVNKPENFLSTGSAAAVSSSQDIVSSSALRAAEVISLAAQHASSSVSEALSVVVMMKSPAKENQNEVTSSSMSNYRSHARQKSESSSNQSTPFENEDEEGSDAIGLKSEPRCGEQGIRGETRILPWHSSKHPLVIEDEEDRLRLKRKRKEKSDQGEEPRSKNMKQLDIHKRGVPKFSGGERLIKFIVGKGKDRFEIHENFICHYSPAVKRCLDSCTIVETPIYKFETDTFTIKKMKASDFSIFSAWVYTRCLEIHGEPLSTSQMYRILNLASVFEMTDLHNIFVDLISDDIAEKEVLITRKIAVLYALGGVVRDLLVCHCCTMVTTQGWGKDWDEVLDPELLLAVYRKITNSDQVSAMAKDFVMPAADKFHYVREGFANGRRGRECTTPE